MGTVNLMPTSRSFSVNSQKGAIPLVAIAVIAIVAIGGIFLISKNSGKSQKPPQTQVKEQKSTAIETSPSVQWETYKDEDRGYTLKHPEGWTVENLPAEGRQLIKVSDNAKSAFVLIEAFAGPSLDNEDKLSQVIDYLEEKLKKTPDLKITSFSRVEPKNGIGGYNAKGEEADGEKTVLFEEKMIVGTTGRSIRIHAAYHPDSEEINRPLTTEIINSFSIN